MQTSSALLRPLFQLRWFLTRPLKFPVLPKCFPSALLSAIPLLRHLPYLTVGDLLLVVPMLILFIIGCFKTFVNPSIQGSGDAAAYAIILTFLLANKSNSIFTFLLGMSFEQLVPFHHLASWVAVILSFFHGYVAFEGEDDDDDDDDGSSPSGASDGSRDRHHRHLSGDDSVYSVPGPQTNLWKFCWDGGTNLSGSLIVVCLVGLVGLSAFRIVRHYCFDLWLALHLLFSAGVILFCLLHAVPILLVILVWWLVDLALRYVLQAACWYPHKARLKRVVSCSSTDSDSTNNTRVVEIRLVVGDTTSNNKRLHFEAGQFVRIAVPAIGLVQFHPFTISSAPYEDEVTMHVKVLGDWTQKLWDLATTTTTAASNDKKEEEREEMMGIDVWVEGPYGSLSLDLLDNPERYPMVVCIGGGIGITPCRSIVRQLVHEEEERMNTKVDPDKKKTARSKIQVIWTVRDAELVNALSILDHPSNNNNNNDNIISSSNNNVKDIEVPSGNNDTAICKVQTDIYLTRKGNVKKDDDDDDDDDNDGGAGGGDDDVPSSGVKLHHGHRPDWNAVFDQLEAEALSSFGAETKTRIAVVVCGPKTLVAQVQRMCRERSTFPSYSCGGGGGVSFDFHQDVFEY